MQRKTLNPLRSRGNNFSKEEELGLVKIISQYKHIVENKNTDEVTPSRKEEGWQQILKQFNSCHNMRTLTQIKSKYDNLKTGARKYFSNINRNLYGTGGGPAHPPDPKNVIYEEVINIINKKTIQGLTNMYDDDNIIIEEVFDETEEESTSIVEEQIQIVVDQDDNLNAETKEKENIEPSRSTEIKEKIPVWSSYTPKMLREPKNKKLLLKNKPAPQKHEAKTFFSLKQQYIEQKIQNLKNEDRRKQERHEKEMELLNIEIENKRKMDY